MKVPLSRASYPRSAKRMTLAESRSRNLPISAFRGDYKSIGVEVSPAPPSVLLHWPRQRVAESALFCRAHFRGGRGARVGQLVNGFLPSTHAGTVFESSGDPILYLSNPTGEQREPAVATRRYPRDESTHMDETGDREIASRILPMSSLTAWQSAGPGCSISRRNPATLDMYGMNPEATRAFGTNCLLARRLVERGVRLVTLMHASWDHHSENNKVLSRNVKMTNQPAARVKHEAARTSRRHAVALGR